MEIKRSTNKLFRVQYKGVAFDVACTPRGDFVGICSIDWDTLAAATNTHPEALLDLITEAVYCFQTQQQHRSVNA